MPSRTAGRLCPKAIFVPVRMKHYEEVSRQMMAILEEFTPLIEPVSIDEAFLDIHGVLDRWASPVELARKLKTRIRERLDLTASVGVAPNKFLAKLASDLQKPDGLSVIPPDPKEILAFLAPLPIRRIWGVGRVTERQLNEAGITTIGQIQAMTERDLAKLLGQASATHIWTLAHGVDNRPIETHGEEKSISNETTFDRDCSAPDVWRQTLIELAENVGRRLREAGKVARTTDIKVRLGDFTTFSRQTSFPEPTNSDQDILHRALELFEKMRVTRPIRLLGVGVSNLTPAGLSTPNEEASLFPEWTSRSSKKRNRSLDEAVDKVRRKLGSGAIKRGNWRLSETPRSEERGF
jgi:DNA polymerase-4